jgi:hypothetical protein
LPGTYPPAPRKQRTRAHVLADLSANHVEKFALQCGFAVERLRQDYGLDLAVYTFDERGYCEAGLIWMQLKASDHIRTSADGSAVAVRLDRRDILAWISQEYPVILVMYDAICACAYWLSIQTNFAGKDVFAKLGGKTVTVWISKENLISEAAIREFARLKATAFAPEGNEP